MEWSRSEIKYLKMNLQQINKNVREISSFQFKFHKEYSMNPKMNVFPPALKMKNIYIWKSVLPVLFEKYESYVRA